MCSPKATDLIIRRYQPTDKDGVHSVYRKGMEFNMHNGLNSLATNPMVLFPLISFATVTGWLTSRKSCSRHVSFMAAVSAALIPFASLYLYGRSKYRGLIKKSLETDLSEIEQIYNGRGCFLVAVDTDSQQIVGTAGAQAKDEKGVFELRRVFVDIDQHRRGIARKLLAALETEIQPRLIYLTCSSTQYAAHGLYRNTGYKLKEVYHPPEVHALIRMLVRIYRFEKEFPTS